MWKANRKTATLLILLDGLFATTDTNERCFLWGKKNTDHKEEDVSSYWMTVRKIYDDVN
jgi:hypothetical protein